MAAPAPFGLRLPIARLPVQAVAVVANPVGLPQLALAVYTAVAVVDPKRDQQGGRALKAL